MIKDPIKAALDYHRFPVPGKVSVMPTKATLTQEDLALCYTPGVAEPVKKIANDPTTAYHYTSKGNLIAVISNGTAILGLGNLGALASKPVMEGKGVLFKILADIDVFDIEVDCKDAQSFIDTVIHISPTFGGINLEDIKAPECFVIEEALRKQLKIPVFHDDQHGTAIVAAAGLLNALDLQGKDLREARIVFAGAGAAGVATAKLLIELGAQSENIYMVDRTGIIHHERRDLNEYKQAFAVKTTKRSLADALVDADVFIGLSGPDIMTSDMLKSMAKKPVVFALSNPVPEIMPDFAHEIRKDLIIATGRSDYPNQVNNALCFPYIFRGALDVHASCINETMKLAAVYALKDLAREPVPQEMLVAYNYTQLEFGANYILPLLLDKRLKSHVAEAVAKAAIISGTAQITLSTTSHV
ncbi:MAG: maeB [Gammaproteobacteria bacterium]|jgi:malic enzyme|nr:maeB [Gammaproteobacteria bacterium]